MGGLSAIWHDVECAAYAADLDLWREIVQEAGGPRPQRIGASATVRPVEDTARDTQYWLQATPDAALTGLTRDEETAVLEAWAVLRSAGD